MRKFSKNDEAIRKLSPEQYRVTQQNGTEAPGTGEYLNNNEPGIYVDIVSGEPKARGPAASEDSPTRMNADAMCNSASALGMAISFMLHADQKGCLRSVGYR